MSEEFAAALRAELLVLVRQDTATSQRWRKATVAVLMAVAAAIIVAVVVPLTTSNGSSGVSRLVPAAPPSPKPVPSASAPKTRSPSVTSLPGSSVSIPVAATVTISTMGTQTVELGTAPAGADAIDLKLTCLTAGSFTFADGAGLTCDVGDLASDDISRTAVYQQPLTRGQHTTTITAANGTRWRLLATYAKVTTSAWGRNANGQTYGVANTHGTPDLVGVDATNGKIGYVYATQLQSPTATSPAQALAAQEAAREHPHVKTLRVYEPDGKTVIGTFVLQ